ncbi:hypothetical protein BC938DRAFT_471102 [Jimgerdemannia flammicorona]|uniref:Uncharacterized protein n=1 Tax=Jimgerdemannia flammicorona TaxID=994334 RepID=A0A433QV07_9FUNG|nr:hypothetical protein BC938DRAFT_471102 [Jimgerdemannia flammicorona]
MITLRSGRILKRVPVRHPHRPKLRQVQAPLFSDDGYNVKDTTINDACYISPLRLTGLFDLWQTCKVLVVCGPPSSGKTVLAYKLIEHIGLQHDEESVIVRDQQQDTESRNGVQQLLARENQNNDNVAATHRCKLDRTPHNRRCGYPVWTGRAVLLVASTCGARTASANPTPVAT